MEIRLKRTKDGNPIGDMEQILDDAKVRLNGSVKSGMHVSFENSDEEVIVKIRAV